MRNRAYCPTCDSAVLVDLVYVDERTGNLESCCRCEGLMLYDSEEQYLDTRAEQVLQKEDCDHRFGRPHGAPPDASERCVYCGLLRGNDPRDNAPERVLERL